MTDCLKSRSHYERHGAGGAVRCRAVRYCSVHTANGISPRMREFYVGKSSVFLDKLSANEDVNKPFHWAHDVVATLNQRQ